MKVNSINFQGTFCIPPSNNFAKNKDKIIQKATNRQAVIDDVKFRDFICEQHITLDDKYDDSFRKF